jgi:hypothetical protein
MPSILGQAGDHGTSWKAYTGTSGYPVAFYSQLKGLPNIVPSAQIVADAAADLLPALGMVWHDPPDDEHPTADVRLGQATVWHAVDYGQPDRVLALFEAELSENAMNDQLCGYSTGEALSRWSAAAVSTNALADFATAPTWFANGMPNWVDRTEPTDQGVDSTGCGMAFLSWLLSQGHTLPQIAQQMVALGDTGTLAELYAQLTGNAADTAWTSSEAAVNALPAGVTSDDPFDGFPNVGVNPVV